MEEDAKKDRSLLTDLGADISSFFNPITSSKTQTQDTTANDSTIKKLAIADTGAWLLRTATSLTNPGGSTVENNPDFEHLPSEENLKDGKSDNEQLQALREKNQQLQTSLLETQQQVKNLYASLTEKEAKCAVLSSEVKTREFRLGQAHQKIERQDNEMRNLKLAKDDVVAELTTLKKTNKEMESEKNDLVAKYCLLTQELEDQGPLKEKYNAVVEKKDQLAIKCASLTEMIKNNIKNEPNDHVLQNLQSLDLEQNNGNQKIIQQTDLKLQYDSVVEVNMSLEKEKNGLLLKIKQLETKIAELQKSNKSYLDANFDLERDHRKGMEENASEWTEKITKLKLDNEELTTTKSDLETKIDESQLRLGELESHTKSSIRAMEQARKQLEIENKNLLNKIQLLEKKQLRIPELERQVHDLNKKQIDLGKKYNEEVETNRQRVQDLKGEAQNLAKKINNRSRINPPAKI